jgi:hypothetical protein
MLLGGLITHLTYWAHQYPDAPVLIHGDRYPDRFMSWRGVYAELTLTSSDKPKSIAQLLDQAKACYSETFVGYKGGDYRMDENTPVWADEYGRTEHWGIMGVQLVATPSPHLVLQTADLSDYR